MWDYHIIYLLAGIILTLFAGIIYLRYYSPNRVIVGDTSAVPNQLQQFMFQYPDAAYIKDINNKFTYLNPAFCELFDIKISESKLRTVTDFDFYTQEQAANFFREDQQILTGIKESLFGEEQIRIGKSEYFMRISKTPILNQKDEIIGCCCLFSDITQYKESWQQLVLRNEELSKEKNLLRAILDNVPDTIYIKDKHGKFLDANPLQIQVTKAGNVKNLLGKSDYDFYPKDIADIFDKDDRQVLDTGDSIINKEEIGFDAEGKICIRSTTKVPFYNEDGNIVGLVGIGRDITQQKRTEDKLKEQAQSLQEINVLLEERQEEINQQSEELTQQNQALENERNLLRSLINNIPDFIYIKDLKGSFIAANQHLLNNFGFKVESEIIGKTDFDLFPKEYAEQYSQDERAIISSGKALPLRDEPTINKDGKVISLLTTKAPYKSPDGEVLGIIGIGRDITKLKEAEYQLQEQADHLKEVNVLLEERQEEIQQQSNELSSQNRLLENERNLLRTLIDSLPDYIFIKDTDSKYVTANRSVIELTQSGSLENLIGKTDYDFFGQELGAKTYDEENKIFQSKEALSHQETRIKLATDKQLYVSATKVPYFDADGRLLGLVGIWRDITELKQITDKLTEQSLDLQEINTLLEEKQEEIRQQSEFLAEQNDILEREKNLMQTLIDHMPDYIYVKDKDSKFLLANKSLLKTMHVNDLNGVIGKTDLDMAPFADIAHQYYQDERLIIQTNQPIVNKEETGYDADGRPRIISTTKVPFLDAEGNIAGIVGIGRDITKQKSAEKQLREQAKNLQDINQLLVDRQEKIQQQSEKLNNQAASLKKANQQLEQLNATKNKFFSIIAHDLKNPFQAIFGFSELLMRNYNDYDEKQQYELLSMIKTSSESAYNLLENLLQWARTQTDRIKYNPISFDIKPIIDQNLSLIKASLEKKRLTLQSELGCDTTVYADQNMINLVVRNILSNAIKFTDYDGLISIHCFIYDTGHLAVSITDTGIGMTQENINKLFRIDEYFSTSGTSGEGGTGLGLIICKEFIERNKGEINVQSESDVGTTFTFTLPRTKIED